MKKDELIMKLLRRVDIQNRLQIPKNLILIYGRDYFVEVYKDKIVLIPKKDEEK